MSDGPILAALARLEAKVDAGQGAIVERLDRLEGGQARLAAGVAELEADQTQLRVAVMARLDRVQDTLTGMYDDIRVNFGRADAVRNANDNTGAELLDLNNTVAAMQRQIQNLQAAVRELKGET